jgi:hypothetical protein
MRAERDFLPYVCGREARVAGQPGFFDLDERYAALSSAGDPLVRLALVVEFELFRAELEAALERSVNGGEKMHRRGGAKMRQSA